jgi:hypothetical protein
VMSDYLCLESAATSGIGSLSPWYPTLDHPTMDIPSPLILCSGYPQVLPRLRCGPYLQRHLTGKNHAFPSDTKTDFPAYLRFPVSWYENYGWTPRILRRNIENVLKSEEIVRYLDAKHIRIQNSAPYSHWQQSVERDIQTIAKGTSCLLHDQEFLNATYWDHSMVHFVDVICK